LDEAYKHELYISQSINDIYAVAYELKEFKTMQFLDWFVKEQGEEEKMWMHSVKGSIYSEPIHADCI